MKRLTTFPVPSARPSRVVIADPYPVIVHGIRKMMEDDPRLQVVAEASTLSSCQSKVLAQRPEVALVDWSMASQDLAASAAFIQSDMHTASIVFLTVSENTEQKKEMLRLGARAFVSKWSSASKLRSVVLHACDRKMAVGRRGRVGLSEGHSKQVVEPEHRIRRLTERERQLLPLVCRGLKNKEIAAMLNIAESTVWHHLTAIFSKLEVGDRLGLTIFSYAHRLVLPDDSSKVRSGEAVNMWVGDATGIGQEVLGAEEPIDMIIPTYLDRANWIGDTGAQG